MFGNCCGCLQKESKPDAKCNDLAEKHGNASVLNRNLNEGCNNTMEIKLCSEHEKSPLSSSLEKQDVVTLNNYNCGVNAVDSNEKTSEKELENRNDSQNVLEGLTKIEVNSENLRVEIKCEEATGSSPLRSIMKRKSLTEPIIKQPKICPDLKRQSLNVCSVEEPEDEVFVDGVNPVSLSKNLGTPYPEKRDQVPLPKWFSEEDENSQEVGGIHEPPATPIGKDELALRRHRFFSELLNATRNAEEHRVRFDPLGPVVAGVNDGEFCQQFSCELETLISRLENVTTRLESIYLPFQLLLNGSIGNLQLSSTNEVSSVDSVCKDNQLLSKMSLQGFQDIIQGPLVRYLSLSQQIGGDVEEQSKFVKLAFDAQYQYLVLANESKQPSQADQINLLQPTSQHISSIQDYREKHRTSQYFNHLSAISESIPALGWVTITPAPAPYIKEMNDAGQFYTNRVLKDWKEKDKKHVDWVKAWIETLTELQNFVKQHHTTGLIWAGKESASGPAVPPPPPPACPPPPSIDDVNAAGDLDRSALFAEINQGENITKNLKKVTAEMQTHKNPALRQGPVPFKAPAFTTASSISTKPAAPVDKPPVFTKEGKKWLIEFQKNNHSLVVENVEMNNVVYLYKCENSTVTVKGKLNSITLDSCKKTSIVFDSLVAAMEFINCQSVQMQVFGKVPTISIDKTDGCQMYLSNESLDVEIVSSKSSEMNVLVPKANGDYAEYPIPEQFKTTIQPGRGLYTVIVESKG